jgi:hypothetical protein
MLFFHIPIVVLILSLHLCYCYLLSLLFYIIQYLNSHENGVQPTTEKSMCDIYVVQKNNIRVFWPIKFSKSTLEIET